VVEADPREAAVVATANCRNFMILYTHRH